MQINDQLSILNNNNFGYKTKASGNFVIQQTERMGVEMKLGSFKKIAHE
jgi:hypothetical protein